MLVACNTIINVCHIWKNTTQYGPERFVDSFCQNQKKYGAERVNGKTMVDCVADAIVGMTWSAQSNHLLLSDIQLVPGFTVTCNISNVHAYLLTTASVSVLRKLFLAYFSQTRDSIINNCGQGEFPITLIMSVLSSNLDVVQSKMTC